MMRNMKRVAKEVCTIFCRAMVIIDKGGSLNIFDQSLAPIQASLLRVLKVAESQKCFHFGSNLPKNEPNHYPEVFLAKEKMLAENEEQSGRIVDPSGHLLYVYP